MALHSSPVRRSLLVLTALCSLTLLAGPKEGSAPAKPGSPRHRFRNDANSQPVATLLPVKPGAFEKPGPEALDRFDRWSGDHQRGLAADADGVALARTRREAMVRLIEKDPREALRRSVHPDVRARMPKNVAAEVEETIRGVGSLVVVCAMPADRNSPVEIQREVQINGKHYRAFTSGHRLEQACADQTPIFGVALGDVLALNDLPYRQLDRAAALRELAAAGGNATDAVSGAPLAPARIAGAIDEGDRIAYFGSDEDLNNYLAENWTPYIAEFGGTAGGPGTTNAWTQGTRKFVAYRARFAEDATNYEPFAYSSGVAAYNTCSNWFYEWSYGSCTMQFVVVTNVYVFTNSGAWYEANGGWPKVLSDCRAVSTNTPESYTNFNFDSVTHNWNVGLSGYAGVAYVGGRGASFHEGYGANDGVVGHEYGHNLGLPHNNFWDTGGMSIIGPGTHSEYGNDYDIMGNGYADWPYAANMRNRLSWLPDMHAHYNVTAGVHRVYAFDAFPLFLPDTNAPVKYALAMPKDGRNYVFEFRQDTNRIGANQSMLNGVLLEVDSGFAGGPELLDCTPGSSGGKSDAMLTIGRMFTDPGVNLHVTPVARGATSRTNWIDLVVHRNTQLSNHPPALAVTASAYTTTVGVAVTLTGTAADPDGDELAYYWEFGDGNVSYNNTNVQSKSWAAAGVYAVRCVAADMHGREVAGQILVTVGSPGAKFRIGGRVTSPSGAPVQAVRITSGSGPTVYSDFDGRYEIPNLSAGSYTLTAYGADTYGNNFTFTYNFANPVTVGPDQPDANIVAATVSGTNVGTGTGFLYERWDGIAGATVSALTADPTYPGQPDDQRVMVGYFEAPTDRGDNYGTRMRAIYTAPQTGLYTFYIASDDNSELWFSTTTNPASATRIATVPNWTASRAWTTYTNQKSAAIALVAGQKCYIEALQKEGSGGDNLAVGSDLPDGSQERPIPFHRLDPWPVDSSAPLTFITVGAVDASASETGGDAGSVELVRSGDLSADTTVAFQLAGSATYDIDYLPTGVSAFFAAGETQAVVTITPRDDAFSEPVETVVLKLLEGADYGIVGAGTVTVSIVDNEATAVTVTAPDSAAGESGNAGLFVVTRTGVSTGTITVGLSVAGSASNGVDFTALPSSVVIPAGSSTASFVVSPVADGIPEIAETVLMTVQAGAGYAVGSPSSATVTIAADAGPGTGVLREWWTGISGSAVSDLTSNTNYPATPTGSAILTNLFEAPTDWADNYGTRCRGYFIAPVSGSYYFYIASDDASDLLLGTNTDAATATRIAYVSSWTASRAWTSYASQKSAAIPLVAGQQVYIEALHKEGGGGDNLAVGVEYPGGYQELPAPYHRFNPFDTQKPTVSIVANDAVASETGDTGSVLVARSSEGVASSLTVALTYGGTAGAGADYATMSTQAVFGAGVTNVWLKLTPIDDAAAEGPETVTVAIVDNAARFFTSGSASQAVVTIDDDDVPTITVTATAAYAYEAGPTSSTFVIARTGPTANPVTITYTLAGSATLGSDFAPLPGYITTNGTVTLAAGQVATNLELAPVNDASAEGAENITLQLSADALYVLGSPAADTITILDDDVAPTIALNSPGAPVVYIPSGVGLVLDATTAHNGLPNPPSTVTQIWTQTSGPTGAVATLATSNDWKNATATFPTIGTYVLTLTAVAGSQSRTTNVTVNVGTFGGTSWSTGSVGFVTPAATISLANGTNTITSSGRPGLVGGTTTDNFSYVMMPVAGDCSITARVVSVQGVAGTNSFGGVIMRESLSPGSKYATMGMRALTSIRARFTARSTNSVASRSTTVGSTQSFPYWVRLDRSGNVFRAYYSSAGTTWTQLSVTNIAMSNTIYIGVAASSGSNGVAGTAVFDRIGIVSTTTVANVGPFVSAGGAVSVSLPGAATLAGSASDDGRPSVPGTLSFSWSRVAGPGDVTFTNAATTNTAAAFTLPGTYTLRLTANDGQVRTFSDTSVTASGTAVRIEAIDAWAASPGTNTGMFVVTREGATNDALTVNLAVAGSAVAGTDYVALATQVVIAAGASNATFDVRPIDILTPRDTVTVVVAIGSSAAYAIASPAAATVYIANTNPPRVSVVATDPNASEPPGASDPAVFTFTRVGGTNHPLTVNFHVGGTATSGVDFVAIGNSVTFPTGATNATVTVTPIDHDYGQAPLIVIVSLVATDATYIATAPDLASAVISNRNFQALSLVWRGLTNNVWDLATTPNWYAPETAASNVVYSNNYSVTFDDSPGVLTNVTIQSGALPSPARVTVDASTNGFSLSGAAGLVGTGVIVKTGTQRLLLGGASNAFSGPVVISNGVLAVTTANALGSTAGGTFVTGSGALDVNGLSLGLERVTIAGAGSGGAGAVVNSGGQQITALQYLTLAGDAAIGGVGRWDVRAGTSPFVNLNGFTLTKTGTNYIALVSTAVTNAGSIVVNQGTLAFSVNTPVAGPGTITINAGGTLAPGNFGGSPTTLKPIILNGGTLLEDNGSGGATVGAPIALNAGGFTNAFNAPDASLVVSNVVSGPGALTKTGGNNLYLTAANTYTGGTLVSAGALFLGNNTAGGSVPGVITNNATVFIHRSDYCTLTNTMVGTGVLNIRNTVSLDGGGNVACSNLYVAQSAAGQLNIQAGASVAVMALFLGNPNGYAGTIVQSGGVVNVTGGDSNFRIAHWPSETSVYNLHGGHLACSNTTVSIGWDGAGYLNVTGGTMHALGLNIPRATHAGPGTFNLSGGTVRLGTGGLTQGGGTATINLNGGTLGAYANWSSAMAMTLGGSNGPVAFDTSTNTITLTGAISGTGGLVKAGSGALVLPTAHTFSGGVTISNGLLLLNGRLAGGADVAGGGTLGGTGAVAGVVANGGLLAPAFTNVGAFTISNAFTQTAGGTLQIQIATNSSADRLVVMGPAGLDGALSVALLNGHVPATGATFTVLTASSLAGTFAATNLPALPVHRFWTVTYTSTSVVLGVSFTNAAPALTVPGPHVLALGSTTNFTVTAADPELDATTITNTVKPAGATFAAGSFAWTATLPYWNTTSLAVFVATDALGAVTTNSATLVVPFDADGDGLPDNWEWSRLATLTNGAGADLVGKGSTLLEDFIAGTDPTNRQSLFRAVGISNAPSLVTVATVSGRVYRVWFTDTALDAVPAWSVFSNQANGIGTWLETNPPVTAHTFVDDYSANTTGHAPTNGVRFYRIDVRLAP